MLVDYTVELAAMYTVVEVIGRGWVVVNDSGKICDKYDPDLLWMAQLRAAEYVALIRFPRVNGR